MHIDNDKKDILVLGEDPTQGLDDNAVTADAKYLLNFTRPGGGLASSLHYNGSNSSLLLMPKKCINSKQTIQK